MEAGIEITREIPIQSEFTMMDSDFFFVCIIMIPDPAVYKQSFLFDTAGAEG